MGEHVGDSGLGRDPGPDIFISGNVLAALERVNAEEERPVEGLLGGQLVFSRFRPAILVEEVFFYPLSPVGKAVSTSHWQEVQSLFLSEFPESRILGWFAVRAETVPVLEGADRLRSASFFGDHWQIALVMDGTTKVWKVFSWQNGQLKPSTRIRVLKAESFEQMKQVHTPAKKQGHTGAPGQSWIKGRRRWVVGFGIIVSVILAVIALVGPASRESSPDFTQLKKHTVDSGFSSLNSSSGAGASSTEPGPTAAEPRDSRVRLDSSGLALAQKDAPAYEVSASGNGLLLMPSGSTIGRKGESPSSSVQPGHSSKWKRYVVKKGDTLWAISKKLLGDANRYKEIWKVNPFIADPDLVPIGIEILIPDVSGENQSSPVSGTDSGKHQPSSTQLKVSQ